MRIAPPSQVCQLCEVISAIEPPKRIMMATIMAPLSDVNFCHLGRYLAAHFRPSRSIARAPVNIPRVFEISANPCQYEITLALIAGAPSSVISAICLTKGSIGMTLPGICARSGKFRMFDRRSYLLLELYLVSAWRSQCWITYPIVEGSPVEDTAKYDTSPKCLENGSSTKC